MHRILTALSCLCVFISLPAQAQGIGVSPIYLELRPDQRATSVRVTNGGDTQRSFEVDVRAWSQHNGVDTLAETRAFIVSPSVFEVAPQSAQIVRIARRPDQPTPSQSGSSINEQSFRVFVREIPAETVAPSANGLRLQLELSLPLFVNVTGAAPNLAARWTASGLEITNSGGAHARLAQVDVGGQPIAGAPRYLLAGQSFVRDAANSGEVRVRMVGALSDVSLNAPAHDRAR